uniref:Acidic phospholipase A2 PLA-2 n=1 Tax=Eristicophis macmahoni TaxID=110227 RepID=PA2A2_ERIMA|nr:RecName: Full=Acidic phospholipase A2 PLA-2; Short=svPLA2; AltName: Full=Phosphatidylcholine 2-acylhydrolase [Eristicophis macmahoni]AAB20147.1 phospholipase A2-2, PLA-2 [Eristocophis macmahoni=leaf-nosed viper, Peptide, 121 aa] [Eristicophis macmahoni]
NLYQFGEMISKKTGTFGLFSYVYYGCYCGLGGKGKPLDATDRCCFVHDCCYGRVNGCNPKLSIYSYSFQNGDIVCGDEEDCLRDVCECDRVAAICFGENMNTYNKKYVLYSFKECNESDQC